MGTRIHWGILGTGFIASKFAESVIQSPYGTLGAVASRGQARADEFAKRFDMTKAYSDYDQLLSDPDIDAVYIAAPHPFHHQCVTRSLKAGKPTLCEKPIGMNTAEVRSLFDTARKEKVFLMEAYMYRCHPRLQKAIDLVKDGQIGELVSIEAHFCFEAPFDADSRLFNRKLGGGAILDVGGYPASFCRLFAGIALGQPFAEPISIMATGKVNPDTHCDEHAAALLEFPAGIQASISCATRFYRPEMAVIYGSKGSLQIDSPWIPEAGQKIRMLLKRQGRDVEIIESENPRLVWSYEVDKFAQAMKDPQSTFPAMTPEDSLGNSRLLEQWMQALKCDYPPKA